MLDQIYHMLDPVAFTIGPFTARWYGIAYVLGFLFAAIVMYRTAKRWNMRIDSDFLARFFICIMIGVIVGARIGYIFFYNFDYYMANPASMLDFSQGGMSFHGGVIGAMIGGLIASRWLKMPFFSLADVAIVGAPIGLFFGRCANFINGELWGAPTDLPWGVVFGGAAGAVARHPSQLYEALLEGVLLFIILYALSRKFPPRPQGTYLGTFMVGYGICRFLVEFIRQPDAQIGYLMGDWLTMGQVLSLPLVVFGIALLVYAYKRKVPQQGPPEIAPAAGKD